MLNEIEARALVRSHPKQLLQVLKDRSRTPYELFLAAEYAAQTNEPKLAEFLVPLLRHDSALVREGAARGLVDCADDPHANVALREAAEKDPIEAVRIAAADALNR